MTTIAEALQDGRTVLAQTTELPKLEAELLLLHVLKKTRAYLYTYPEQPVTPADFAAFQGLVQLRLQGQPIAYLIGEREFWSLPLRVSKDTLIPRPETEYLVEAALTLMATYRPLRKRTTVLDLGTGSGAIALALATERPDLNFYASDQSPEALAIAKANASQLGLSNVEFFNSDWFNDIQGSFDFIVSNPPYLAEDDPHLAEGDLRFEPRSALVGGEAGLASLATIITQGLDRLVPGGWLLVEHGYLQKKAVWAMLSDRGYGTISAWQDGQGRDRISAGRRPV